MGTTSTRRASMLAFALMVAIVAAFVVTRRPTGAADLPAGLQPIPATPATTAAPPVDAAPATPAAPPARPVATQETPPGHFYVEPARGSDDNAGTAAAPFATLGRAQAAARQALSTAESNVVVNLVGSAVIDEPLVLTAADSGRPGVAMVYRAAPGSAAIIDGGIELDGWEAGEGGLYSVAVPDGVDGFRQFYADGMRQPRARTATAEGTAVRFTKEQILGRARDHSIVVATELVERFSHPEDLELVYIGVHIAGHGVTDERGNEVLRPSWRAHRLPVEAAVARPDGTTRLDIAGDALYHATQRGFWKTFLVPSDPFYLENARELIDEPGEWFFDPRERRLWWLPPRGVVPEFVETWIPNVETLVDIDGTISEPVEYVRFEGITFRHSTYLVPDREGYVSGQGATWFTGWEPDDWMAEEGLRHPYLDRPIPQGLPAAAVEIDSAHDIVFVGNTFTHLGAAGVLLHNDVTDAWFTENTFRDLSGSGLIAGHEVHDVLDHPLERLVERVRFDRNVVEQVGREYYTALGVKVFKAADFVIANNRFSDTPYSAVSMGWGWDRNPSSTVHVRNRIERNHFTNVVNMLYDGAAIYLLGPTGTPDAPLDDYTVVAGNFIDYSTARPQLRLPGERVAPGFQKRPGIQIDEGNRNLRIDGNVVIDASVWLQVTEWPVRNRDRAWRSSLRFIGEGNWSNGLPSVPDDLTLVGLAPVAPFDFRKGVVAPVAAIRAAAGPEAAGGGEPDVSVPGRKDRIR